MIDITKLFNDLDQRKKQFSELVGNTKSMIDSTELKEEDKAFFKDAISNAMQGKDLSIELLNNRAKKIIDASRSDNTKY